MRNACNDSDDRFNFYAALVSEKSVIRNLSLVMLLFFSVTLQAQSQNEGRIVVKFKTAPAVNDIKASTFSAVALLTDRIPTNSLETSEIASLNFTRVFPYAGKHEERHKAFGLHLWYYVESSTEISFPEKQKSVMSRLGLFEIVTEEPKVKHQAAESHNVQDSLFSRQWNFYNYGQTDGTAGADIELVNALKLEKGRKEVIVSIHDSGIDSLDTDVMANLWTNEGEIPDNGIDDDNNGYIDDVHGWNFARNNNDLWARHWHGPSIAGIIAGKSNGRGVLGIAGGDSPDNGVRLMICRTDSDFSNLDVINPARSVVYAADNGSVISSNSWNSFGRNHVILTALNYYTSVASSELIDHGMLVFSAGNNASASQRYEKEAPGVIMIASTDHDDKASGFTNFGDWIDLSAPGEDIFSNDINGGFRLVSGTSFSAPHVAGVAALVLSKYGNTDYTFAELVQKLKDSSDPIDDVNSSRYKEKLGAGRLNAFKALLDDDALPPERVTDTWIAETHAYWVDIGLKTPLDNTIAPFAYEIGVRNKSARTDTLYRFDVSFPVAGDSLVFRLEGLEPDSNYGMTITAIDYFDNDASPSDSIYFASSRPPRLLVNDYQQEHDFERDMQYNAQLSFENTGSSKLSWSISEKDPEHRFDGLLMKISNSTHDELIDYVASGGGQSSLLPQSFQESDLLKTQLLVLEDKFDTLRSEQVSNLLDWVSNGGNLVIGVGQKGLGWANELLAPFDLSLLPYETINYSYLKEVSSTHPIINGKDKVLNLYLYFYGAYIQAGPQADFEEVLRDEFGNLYMITLEHGKGKMVVSSSQFFRDFQLFTDDNYRLMKNAIDWVSRDYIAYFNESNGDLAPGERVELDLKFNHNLGPVHNDTLRLFTNDDLNPVVRLPYSLRIRGKDKIELRPDSISYDTTYVGHPVDRSIWAFNRGTDSLIASLQVNEDVFIPNLTGINIAPGDSASIAFTFKPTEPIDYEGVAILSGNDDSESIALKGTGLLAPKFFLNSVDTLFTYNTQDADTITKAVTVTNQNGGSPLRYSVSIEESPRSKLWNAAYPYDFRDKTIGVTNLNRNYLIFLSSLPFYSDNNFIDFKTPLSRNDISIDALDVLILDERLSNLTYQDIDAIHEWVANGGHLVIQTGNIWNIEKFEELIGITEVVGFPSQGGTVYDSLRNFEFHPITRGLTAYRGRPYTKYIETDAPGKTIIRDREGRPFMVWSEHGEGKVLLCATELTTGFIGNENYNRLITRLFNWLFSQTPYWLEVKGDKNGTLDGGADANLELELFSGISQERSEAILRFESNDPDSVHHLVVLMEGSGDNNSSPLIMQDLNYEVTENADDDQVIGSVNAIDRDGDLVFYHFDQQEVPLTIDAVSGEVTVTNPSYFDYETRQSGTFPFWLTDGKDSTRYTLEVVINDEDEAPVLNINSTQLMVQEDGNLAIQYSAYDPEGKSVSASVQIVEGEELGSLTIDNDSLYFSGDQDSFGTLRAELIFSDGIKESRTAITYEILPVNDPPIMEDVQFTVVENSPENLIIGSFNPVDVDDSFLSFGFADANGPLSVHEDGKVGVRDSAFFDFEMVTNTTLRAYVTDEKDTTWFGVELNVTDLNEAPIVVLDNTSFDVIEDGFLEVLFTTEDPEKQPRTAHIEVLSGGAIGNVVLIENIIKVTPSPNLNGLIRIRLIVSDGVNVETVLIDVQVIPVNDPPALSYHDFTINENSAQGQLIGNLTATDVDNSELSYGLVSTANTAALISASGEVSVGDASRYNFEENERIEVAYYVTDLQDSAFGSFFISLTDVNEPPTIEVLGSSPFTTTEDTAYSVAFASSDPEDAPVVLSGEIISGHDLASFTLDNNVLALQPIRDQSGQVVVKVTGSDGVHEVSDTITLIIAEVNDPPAVSDINLSILENIEKGALITQLTVTDPDDSDFVFTTSGVGSEAISIDQQGFVYVADSTLFDYEKNSVLNFEVLVSDQEFNASAMLTITLVDVFEGNTEEELGEVDLFPNPAENELTLSFAKPFSNATITVFDANGLIRMTRPVSSTDQLLRVDISGLGPGIYNIRIGTSAVYAMKRFIKL